MKEKKTNNNKKEKPWYKTLSQGVPSLILCAIIIAVLGLFSLGYAIYYSITNTPLNWYYAWSVLAFIIAIMIIFIYKTKFFSNILNGIDQHLNEQQKHKKDIKEASEQQKSDNENISSTIDHQKVEVVSEKENDKHKRRKYHVEE